MQTDRRSYGSAAVSDESRSEYQVPAGVCGYSVLCHGDIDIHLCTSWLGLGASSCREQPEWPHRIRSQKFCLCTYPSKHTTASLLLAFLSQITTVPSFINELSRHVSIHKSIAYPIFVCVALYIIIGLTDAASFNINPSSDLLATLNASDENKVLITIVNILFPVFAIVIRYNLVRGNFCSNSKTHTLGAYGIKN